MQHYSGLGAMRQIRQWFVWRLTWDAVEGKFDKVPCYPDGSFYPMNGKDRSNWLSFERANEVLANLRAKGGTFTLGFQLTADTGYWFLDIDKCVKDGVVNELASGLCARFPGTAWEWSSSGTGLHIFGRGSIPKHAKRAKGLPLEFYSDGRGIAFGLSGDVPGDIDTDHSASVAWLVDTYFPPGIDSDTSDSAFDVADPGWSGPDDDVALITRIERARVVDAAALFGGAVSTRVTFEDLYDCNAAALTRRFPDDAGGFNASSADAAMIGILAFWTGRDAPRIERIMRGSELYRHKWESQREGKSFIRYSIDRILHKHRAEGKAVYGASRVADTVGGGIAPSGAPVSIVPPAAPILPGDPPVNVAPSITVQPVDGERTDTPITPSVDTGKYEAQRYYEKAIAAADTGETIEHTARGAATDPRVTHDLAYTLGAVVHHRFKALGIAKPLSWCRAIMVSDSTPLRSDTGSRPLTEYGNKDRMLDLYGSDLMYVLLLEQWKKWNGTRWQSLPGAAVDWMAQETVRNIYTEANNCTDEVERGLLAKWANDSQRNSMNLAMVSLSKSDPRVTIMEHMLDSDPMVLGAPNGMINLRTGELMAPDKSARVTMAVSCNYDPLATCALFTQTVAECFFGDAQLIAFFKRLMGYTLMGNPKLSLLIIPYGGGANGKSTVFGMIQKVLGDYAKSAGSETLVTVGNANSSNAGGPREDLLRLKGARFVAVSEVEEGAQLREHVIKTLTGNDRIQARGVHMKNTVEWQPQFVPVMSTNHKPIVKGDDEGIWRRLMMVPFMRNFKTDPDIPVDIHRSDRLAAELPGILRWLVEGAIEYQTYGVMEPAAITSARSDYREEQDLLGEWLAEHCHVGKQYTCIKADLFTSWKAYAEPRGLLRIIGSVNMLSRKLDSRKLVEPVLVTGKRGFRGIAIKNPFETVKL